MRELTQKIKALQAIEPDKKFASKSRVLILSSAEPAKKSWFSSFDLMQSINMSAAVALTAILLVSVFSVSSVVRRAFVPTTLTGLDSESLSKEAAEIERDININLDEARYYTVTAQKTVAALEEASLNGPGHLNTSVIEREIKDLDTNELQNKTIDKLLEEVIL